MGKGIFLQDKCSVPAVPARPPAFAVLLVPLPLAGRALPDTAGPPDLALDDFPRHGYSPEADDHSILVHLPKMLFSPTQPLTRPRLFPIWKRFPWIAFTRCRYCLPFTLEFKNLQTLDLYNTQVTDAGVKELKGLKCLRL